MTAAGWLAIGLGGALGAMARHALSSWIMRLAPAGQLFPVGIFLVNVAGSALAGALAGLVASGRVALTGDARLFVVVGLLGGFTTFSTFTIDTLLLARAGRADLAILNAGGQVAVALAAAAVAWRLAS